MKKPGMQASEQRCAPVHTNVRKQLKKQEAHEGGRVYLVSEQVSGIYDHVIVTAQPWAMQVESGFERFRYEDPIQLL